MPKKTNFESLLLPSETFDNMRFISNQPRPVELRNGNFVELKPRIVLAPGSFPYVNINGRMINGAAHFTCATTTFSRLCMNGTAISARSLSYYFSGIQWCPGRGWPTYSNRCPRTDLVADMSFPSAFAHSLIVQFGGYYWPECANSNVGTGNQITDVFVGPNDDKYDDNTGNFEFIIASYGQ